MNTNRILSIIIVVLLMGGLWWFISRTTPQDALSPTPVATATLSPTPIPSVTKTPIPPRITISTPKANAVVDSPILVTGTANVFENQFTVQLKDSTGKVIWKKEAVMTDAKDSGLFGNYSVQIPVPVNSGTNFKIESFSLSPKGDGSFEGYASVMVQLKASPTP